MIEASLNPIHVLPSGLCEDPSGEAAALIERMAKSDRGALAELHDLWAPVFLGIACRMLGERREAEQVVQETFVRIWHRSADYDSHQSPPFVWAFAILRGFCIDHLRFRRGIRKDSSSVVPIAQQADAGIPENLRIMALDDWHRVKIALDQLGPDERGALERAVFLEYTHSEVGESAGCPSVTVKNRLRSALERVRNHLSRYEL